jgi:hypothetical protein
MSTALRTLHGDWVPVAGSSEYLAVTTSTQLIATGLSPTKRYKLTMTVDAMVKQGAADVTATDADGSFLALNEKEYLIDGAQGVGLAIKGEGAGKATLQEVTKIL